MEFIGSCHAGEGTVMQGKGGNIKGLPVTALFNDIGGHTGRIRSVRSQVVLNRQHAVIETLHLAHSKEIFVLDILFYYDRPKTTGECGTF